MRKIMNSRKYIAQSCNIVYFNTVTANAALL